MKITKTIKEIQEIIPPIKCKKKIYFIPTMGNLHTGHLKLIEYAKKKSIVLVSIYVNPLQFGENEDYDTYPRTTEKDIKLLENIGVDIVYLCQTNEIYPEGKNYHTKILVKTLDGIHCGKTRPDFFSGVATIVMKLLNITMPDVLLLGEKDFQQLMVIKKMVSDMCMPVEVIGVKTVRDKNGLAESSRNNYLPSYERQNIAPVLFKTLSETQNKIINGADQFLQLEESAIKKLSSLGFKPDYFKICNAHNLTPADNKSSNFVILAAAYLANTRLIDNISFNIKY